MKRAGCIGNGGARAVFWGLRRADSLSRITLLEAIIALAIAALDASCSAIAVASLLLGQEPDFHVAELPNPSSWTGPIFVLLGFLAGLAGVAYNRLIIKTFGLLDGLTRWRPEVRALFIRCNRMVCPAHDRRRRYH